ncbi:MAG: TetR/AcrR family transcriptional regulator [Rhodospirillales bacterium]|nr:TetR/AcrR family transcriptional regulator [Rhodospirillales bacterium]
MKRRTWKRRKEARPSEISAAALRLFVERGYAATRLDDVAAVAGISKGTLYLYFANKEELFKAVVRETVVISLDRAERIAAEHEGSAAALLGKVMAHFAAMLETEVAAVPKLVIAEAGNFPSLARFYADTVVSRGLALLRRIVERGIESGEFRAVDVDATVPSMIAPFLMMALFKHSLAPHADIRFDSAAVLRSHAELLLRGLAAERPAKRRR